MSVELIDFCTVDGVLNNGILEKKNSNKIIISTHGMTSNCFKQRDRVISKYALENGFDFFSYNNRGSEITKYVTIKDSETGKTRKILGGTAYENPTESYFDIKGAIEKVIELGYTEIYLQGHSLGSTKVVYTYNKLKNENSELLKYIKGIILLSLVDIPRVLKIYLGENYNKLCDFALEKSKNNQELDIMPEGSFINPISIKTFLIYAKYYDEINFAQYCNENFNYDVLNNIKVPLFMRWGDTNEMIEQMPDKLVQMLNSKIVNFSKDINYIKGANHSYNGKEEILASEIINFLRKNSSK